ncbi:2-phospho-L-lactate guanylyltransferase [Nocardioides donggukensis]|uniref:2-phospho-L-lactate guanylyltransferase n=1 Tax=Nocardioides donggukensis TaxID=2774019 RepID=UPI00191E0C77|nr:2-phospho-L-lactate guanylyltransferase [Nocardioides donggukensis]
MTTAATSFTVLVPVKPPVRGKSRLAGLPDDQRQRLAAAFALDTITAARATASVGEVMVVTDDHAFAATARERGCTVLPDGVSGDLNATLVQAAHEAVRRWPGSGLAALCADLPALRPEDLAGALAQVPAGGAAFVADAHGTGTTMYAAAVGHFDPHFGVGSRAAHLRAGATEIPGRIASLRHDVDDVGDLGRALVLGVGTETALASGR